MNQTKVADLTIDEFRKLIQDVVIQTISDLIKDPDHDLDLNPDIEMRLRESLAEYKMDSSLPDAQSVADKLGLA
jgi:hypothetical protein